MRQRSEKLTGWRKIANAVWKEPHDPLVYGILEVDATELLRFIARARANGHHLTATHLVGRAMAHSLAAVPELNVRIVGDRAIARPSVDVFFITFVKSLDGARDLTGVKVEGADKKSVVEVATEVSGRSHEMKEGRDPDLAKSKRLMGLLPRWLLRPILRLVAWFVGKHAMPVAPLGLSASPFGSAMVSSVGMLGLQVGFSPISWLYRVPLLVLAGEIADKPVAVSGKVEVRPVLPITASIDHRYADGAHISELVRAFHAYLADPEKFEPADITKGAETPRPEAPARAAPSPWQPDAARGAAS